MNVACNSPDTVSHRAFISLELQRLWTLLKIHSIELHVKLLRARLLPAFLAARVGLIVRLIGQVVLVFGLSFVATKPKGGGWTRCDLSSWLARSCWFYPGF